MDAVAIWDDIAWCPACGEAHGVRTVVHEIHVMELEEVACFAHRCCDGCGLVLDEER